MYQGCFPLSFIYVRISSPTRPRSEIRKNAGQLEHRACVYTHVVNLDPEGPEFEYRYSDIIYV